MTSRTPHASRRPRATRTEFAAPDAYVFRLYVAGASSRSRLAILQARELCANELRGRSKLEVIDIYQEPLRARRAQIIATPTLVRVRPRPVRRLIGTSAGSGRLLAGLGLESIRTPLP